MKNILFICICFLYSISAHSQIAGNNYIPLEFDNLEPVWSHLSVDSTLIGHEIENSTASYDGYSHFSDFFDVEDIHIVKDGYLYLINKTLYDIDIAGAMIEKIHIETGDLIWKETFDLRDFDIREFVFRATVGDGVLRLYNLSIISPTPEPIPVPIVALGAAEGYLKIREYDILSGALIRNDEPDTANLDLKLIRTSDLNRTQLNLISPDSIEVLFQRWTNQGTKIIVDTINSSGAFLNTTDTLYTLLGSELDWSDSYLLLNYTNLRGPNGNLYWTDYYTPDDRVANTPIANINVYSKDGVEVTPINIPDQKEIFGWYLQAVVDDHLFYKVQYYDDTEAMVLINSDGELIYSFEYEARNVPYIEIRDKDDFIFGLFDDNVDGKWTMCIYHWSENELHKRKCFSLKNSEYAVYPDEIQKLEGGDYLWSLAYNQVSLPISERGRFSAVMRVTPEQLGLEPVSVLDNKIDNSIFSMYPVPSKDQVTISTSLEGRYDLTILSSSGEMIRSIDNVQQSEYILKLSNMSAGTYFLRFETEIFTVTKPFVKVN